MRTRCYLATFSLLLVAACTEPFTEINTNPNFPAEVPPSLLSGR